MGMGDIIKEAISYVTDLGPDVDVQNLEDETEDEEVVLETNKVKVSPKTNAGSSMSISSDELDYLTHILATLERCGSVEIKLKASIEDLKLKIQQTEEMIKHVQEKRVMVSTSSSQYLSYLFAKYQAPEDHQIDPTTGEFVPRSGQ